MRRADWPERLAEFINERRRTPFAWGSNDCALSAADAVLAMTDDDPAKNFRGYNDEREALRIVQGAGGIRGLVDLPEKHKGFAQRGDVVLAEIDGRETLGVCVGSHYAAPGVRGLVLRPMTEVVAVFEV